MCCSAASVDEIEAGLGSATGGTVTIISFTQEVSAEATLPIAVADFDQAAETQFVSGLSTALSVDPSTIVDVQATADTTGRRRLQARSGTKIRYRIRGAPGADMSHAKAQLEEPSFATSVHKRCCRCLLVVFGTSIPALDPQAA